MSTLYNVTKIVVSSGSSKKVNVIAVYLLMEICSVDCWSAFVLLDHRWSGVLRSSYYASRAGWVPERCLL